MFEPKLQKQTQEWEQVNQ